LDLKNHVIVYGIGYGFPLWPTRHSVLLYRFGEHGTEVWLEPGRKSRTRPSLS